MIQQVEGYLAANPGSTIGEIAKTLGFSRNTVTTIMSRMRERGQGRHAKDRSGRIITWELGCEDYIATAEAPEQKRVTSWEPHNFRDPLHVALYGPPAAR